jgi:hypothetical protein
MASEFIGSIFRAGRQYRRFLPGAISAIPLPWPAGFRPETLRPPLSGEFAVSMVPELNLFIGIRPD